MSTFQWHGGSKQEMMDHRFLRLVVGSVKLVDINVLYFCLLKLDSSSLSGQGL